MTNQRVLKNPIKVERVTEIKYDSKVKIQLKMNKELVFLLFLVNVFAIVQSLSDQIDKNNDVLNKTVLDSSGTRFQRILHRKKRFLLFPPGSAIVVSFYKLINSRKPQIN